MSPHGPAWGRPRGGTREDSRPRTNSRGQGHGAPPGHGGHGRSRGGQNTRPSRDRSRPPAAAVGLHTRRSHPHTGKRRRSTPLHAPITQDQGGRAGFAG